MNVTFGPKDSWPLSVPNDIPIYFGMDLAVGPERVFVNGVETFDHLVDCTDAAHEGFENFINNDNGVVDYE